MFHYFGFDGDLETLALVLFKPKCFGGTSNSGMTYHGDWAMALNAVNGLVHSNSIVTKTQNGENLITSLNQGSKSLLILCIMNIG